MGTMIRSRAVAILLAGPIVSPFVLSRRSVAQTTSPLRVITTPIEPSAGVYYAQSLGLFAKHGLNVSIQAMNNGEAAAAAVTGGAADVGVGNILSLAIAHQNGAGLTLVAPAAEYVNAAPVNALVVGFDSPIRTASDLRGRTIAVPAVNDLNMIATDGWIDANGGDSKSVRFTEMPTPLMGAAVTAQRIDAAMFATPFLSEAVANRSCRIIGLPFGAVGDRFLVNAWYAKNDWIASHRDEVARFAAAVQEAQLWANTHPNESGQVLLGVTKIRASVLAIMTRVTFAKNFEPSMIDPVIAIAARYGVLKKTFPANSLYLTETRSAN